MPCFIETYASLGQHQWHKVGRPVAKATIGSLYNLAQIDWFIDWF